MIFTREYVAILVSCFTSFGIQGATLTSRSIYISRSATLSQLSRHSNEEQRLLSTVSL